jgi:uncharacterized protein YbaP (TraB family)
MGRALALGMLVASTAMSQPSDDTTGADSGAGLDEFIVTGRYPGPPLWKVSRGDHVLYVFASLEPLPKGMSWGSMAVEAAIARSQEVIGDVEVRAREWNPIKLFRLYREARQLARNPDEATLAHVLPPDLYTRYAALKARYRPRDKSLETLRPGLAAAILYASAIDEAGLRDDRFVRSELEKIRRRHDVELTKLRLVAEPETLLDDAASISTAAEIDCFDTTLRSIETDLEGMQARALAWAQGDIAALRRHDYPPREVDCLAAIESASGLDALLHELKDQWLAAAELALEANDATFATLPMFEILAPDGLLAELRAKGYRVDEPGSR